MLATDELMAETAHAPDSTNLSTDSTHPKIVVFSAQSDLTLVSSDDVHFQVHSIIMREASEVFATMLSMPQPTGSASEHATVHLSEDSQALELLLAWIYPSDKRPILTTFSQLAPVLTVAKKYEVTVKMLRSLMVLPSIIEADPLAVYFFCVRHDFVEEGRIAARYVIVQDVDVMGRTTSAELKETFRAISHWNVKALADLRQATYSAAVQLIRARLTEQGRHLASSGHDLPCIEGYCCGDRHTVDTFVEGISNPFAASHYTHKSARALGMIIPGSVKLRENMIGCIETRLRLTERKLSDLVLTLTASESHVMCGSLVERYADLVQLAFSWS